MDIEMKCLRCGGKNIKPSDVQSTGRIYSRPKGAKLLTLLTTGAAVGALTCFDCGHVELFVDAKKARAITKSA